MPRSARRSRPRAGRRRSPRTGSANSAAAAIAAQSRRRTALSPGEDGVLVRVGGRAAAEQHERLGTRVAQLVHRAGRDHHAVAGAHGRLLAVESHRPHPGQEQVDLLRDAVVVLGGLAAGRDRGLGERLVGGVAGGHAGQLADRRAVRGDEGFALLEADGLHRLDGRERPRRSGGAAVPTRWAYAARTRRTIARITGSGRCRSRRSALAAWAYSGGSGNAWWTPVVELDGAAHEPRGGEETCKRSRAAWLPATRDVPTARAGERVERHIRHVSCSPPGVGRRVEPATIKRHPRSHSTANPT